MCHRWRTKFLVQRHITSLGAKGNLHGIGQCINTFLQRTTRIFSEQDLFSHNQYSSAFIVKIISLALLRILLNSRSCRGSIFPTRHSTAKELSAQERWE